MTTRLRHFYETGEKINQEPLIYLFENFVQDREIEQLVDAAHSQLSQALVSAEKSGIQSDGRSGRNCWIPQRKNPAIASLSDRVSEVVGIPLENAESLQVVHYRESQRYDPHFDAWDAATQRGQRCLARGGQRLVTCLLYLNDVDEGGETCFPKLELCVKARKGRMLLFHNCETQSSRRHPASLHGGMPVLSGEKWACNFWFRESKYQKATGESSVKVI